MTLVQQKETYQDPQAATVLPFDTKKKGFKIVENNWGEITRSNAPNNPTKKTSVLSPLAQHFLAVIRQKRKKEDRTFLNQSYMTSISKRSSKQNIRIIKQLEDEYEITYHNSITHNGKKHRYVYEFSDKKCPDRIDEKNQSNRSKMSRQNPSTTIYKEKKDIEYNRSNESNFSSSKKIRKFYPNQYDKPKTLPEETPITDQEEAEVYKLSGRMFEKKFLNDSLKHMVKKGLHKRFYSRRQFIVWFSKCMLNELRSVDQTNKIGFYIKGNKTKAEIVEHTTMNDREQYLNKIETDAIHHRSDETQLKAKWAGRLATNTAYNLLKNLSYWRIVGGVMEIYLQKGVDMLEMQKHTLLSQIQAIGAYNEVQEFKLIVVI